MKPIEFLSSLYDPCDGGNIVIRSIVSKNTKADTYVIPIRNIKLPKLTTETNWYFGIMPRNDDDKVVSGSTVAIDIDGIEVFDKKVKQALKPSVIINSGHGFHIYLFLKNELPISEITRLVKLARLALDGDKQTLDPTRLLRIPGTMNVKKKPHVPCEVIGGSLERYEPKKIEELLLAAMLVPYWYEGNRNSATLGFSAIASRCEWTPARIEKVIRTVCSATGDKEVHNRIVVVNSTYERHINGDVITFKEFAECLGEKKQKELLELMGYNAKDGEVKYKDEVIGENATIIQDIVKYWSDGETTWGWDEGQLMEWHKDQWLPREPKTLASRVFDFMDQLVLLKNGHEKRLPAKPANAEGVARMITGTLAARGFDPCPDNCVGFQNGLLNLDTREFRSLKMEDHVKKPMPIAYDPEAKALVWEKFLKESVPEHSKFLQEWVGYLLRRGNIFERMLWVYGQQRTGKSTFLSTIFKMFGQKAVTISSQNISQYQIAMLNDAFLAVCTELSTQRFRTGIFKAMVSGDPVTARHPYGRPFDVQFRGKFMWGSNTLPTLDETEGVWPRLVMVEFKRQPKKMDVLLRQKIEAEISGVLNWALVGYERVQEYIAEGSWPIPFESLEAVSRYRDFSEIVDLFIQEELSPSKGDEVGLREAYAVFNEYAKGMGHPPREFGAWFPEEFRRRGYAITGLSIIGLKLGKAPMANLKNWGIEK